MANIRVYELAKDLNMKNKVLLEKLDEMDIAVRSHMSSLDDETVARVKANLLGKEAVEEMRVKRTVIRRRKKPAQKKNVQAETEKENHSVSPEPDNKGERDEEASGINSVSKTVEQQASEKKPPETVKKEKESAESAGKLDMKKKSEKEKEIAGQKVADDQYTAVEKNEPTEKKVLHKKTDKQVKRNLQAGLSKDKQKAKKEGETVRSPETKRGGVSKDTESLQKNANQQQVNDSKKKSRRRRRKRKKDTPAKIIKLPTQEETLAMEKASVEKLSTAQKRQKENVVPVSDPKSKNDFHAVQVKDNVPKKDISVPDKKKSKKRKEVTIGTTTEEKKPKDIRWTKKKISFKRKEVVEGEELYSGSQRGRKGRKTGKTKTVQTQKPHITTPKAIKRRIKIDDTIMLSDLAKRMGIKASEMIAKLMTLGVMVTVNQTIDFDTAALVAAEFNYEVERASFEEEAVLKVIETDEPEKMTGRPPVVTIMGHVDHGKTSLLDVIRKTRITEFEAGGITQHIGAYNVSTERGNITFLDTPGHEAFTAMRARGAVVTDIVVLVVAADDGVMPQTIEAINHSKAAGVPIIVAVNKIDKANAEPDRVYRELSEKGLVPEDWGGDTIFVKVSAKQNQGIDTLLEMILLQAEVSEFKANADKMAVGYVVEAKLDSGRGPVATVLIQEGTLHTGDAVVCGIHHGKIRAMLNDRGIQVEEASPSIPVEVLGLSGVPNAGDELIALADDKSAKQVSLHRIQKQRSIELAKTSRISLEKLFEKMQQGEVKDLNLIIKADVHGSIEAIRDSLVKLSNEEVTIHVIHSGTGTITESDISLAAVSDAIIIGFNVRPTPKVQSLANEEHVDIRFYNVIYNVIKDIQDAILGMMEPTYEERILGRADVREVFHVPKIGAIAGCYITDGKIQRGQLVRVIRDGIVSFEGKIGSLRRFKDDVKEVQSGYECGIGIENFNDVKVGDILECYYMEEIKPELSVS